MIRKIVIFIALFCAATSVASPWYNGAGAGKGAVPRKVIAFYDASVHPDHFFTMTHQRAEMILNWLGLEVVYRPIDQPLPTESELSGVRAIMTWFDRLNAVPDPEGYCGWMTDQMKLRGRRALILGEPGIFADTRREMTPQCKEMFRLLGVEYLGAFSDNPFFWDVVSKDSGMVEFERSLDLTEDLIYSWFKPVSPQLKTYLVMKRLDMDDSDSTMVFTGPRGGFVHPRYVNYQIRELDKIQWRINPFRFFAEALAVEGLPRPDTTSLNGRRIFISHIDGDGIFNISHIDEERFSGEIIDRDILARYQDVPISAGLIAGYFDLPEFRSPRATQLYRNMLSRPNVEVTSHGYAHPLVWRKRTMALDIPGYRYSADAEIGGSIARITALLKEENISKPVALFQWTGDCLPDWPELAETYGAGVGNINGGTSRRDRKDDSYSFIFPIGIEREGYHQIYAGAPNENDYTNLWQGPYYGYEGVINTFRNTGAPYRLKPIDIYYHFYTGERQAALKALGNVYDYVLTQEVIPIRTSEYARIANDYYDTAVFALPGGGFRITRNGTLRTVRFDGEKRNVDLVRSAGVIGFRHDLGSLYVSLDESPVHDIYLTGAAPARPYVIEASFKISGFVSSSSQTGFYKEGWHKSEIRLGGMLPNASFTIRAPATGGSASGEGGAEQTVASDSHGIISLTFPTAENGGPPTQVVIEIHNPPSLEGRG